MATKDNQTKTSEDSGNTSWIKEGLIFGAVMFIIVEIIIPLIWKEGLGTYQVALKVFIWILAGLLWASLKNYLQRPKNE